MNGFEVFHALFLLFTLSINGGEDNIKNEQGEAIKYQYPYSEDFIYSDFIRGWETIQVEGKVVGCKKAIPFFVSGIQNEQFFDLSTLYYDYCTSTTGKLSSYLTSSLYSGRDSYRGGGLSTDEIEWILENASYNKIVESFALGLMLTNGYKAEKDLDLASEFITVAANGNYAHAQYQLGLLFIEKYDYGDGVMWLERSKELGYFPAESILKMISSL